MREIDPLSLIVLAEHDPMRATVAGLAVDHFARTLLHAKCATDWLCVNIPPEQRSQALERSIRRWRVYLPEGDDLKLWGTGCVLCGRSVDTINLKPF